MEGRSVTDDGHSTHRSRLATALTRGVERLTLARMARSASILPFMRIVVSSTMLAVCLAALGSVVLWPLCNYGELASALYLGDVRLIAWTLAWNNHAMLDGVPSYWDANIFYPAKQTLALSEHLFGISLFSLPVYAATRNPALAYNVVWLFSFPASAVAAHWLAWRYTRDHLASMLAGVIYAFCFFKILHGGGHLQIVWAFWLPVAILLLAWWFERPRWRTTVALAAVITLQCSRPGMSAS